MFQVREALSPLDPSQAAPSGPSTTNIYLISMRRPRFRMPEGAIEDSEVHDSCSICVAANWVFQATSVDIGALTSSRHTSDSRYEHQFLFLHRRFRLSSPDELPPITLATCSVVNCASQACVVWCFSGGRVGVLFGNVASCISSD